MKVLMRYSFIMEPRDEWRSRDDFEDDLARFFATKGLGAEVVKTADQERMIYVFKLESKPIVSAPPINPKSPSQMLKDMQKK